MLKHKIILTSFLLCISNINIANANSNATLGSITQQRGMLEDLSLQVQIQEQSQKLNQLLMPVAPIIPQNTNELSAKQLIEKLEVPGATKEKNSEIKDEDTRTSKVIAIYSNNKTLKAKVKYKGKLVNLTNGQIWNGLKVQIFRDHVSIGNKILEL
ncbi:hypothetical protein [Faecalimonas sp.]